MLVQDGTVEAGGERAVKGRWHVRVREPTEVEAWEVQGLWREGVRTERERRANRERERDKERERERERDGENMRMGV